jgi:hypothetical protein
MKKTLSLLSLLLLLTGCNVGVEQQIAPPSPDGIEVDHGEVLAQLIFADETSVEFTTDFKIYDSQEEADAAPEIRRTTYPFSKDVVIKVIKDGKLVEITPDHAIEISLSSYGGDYYFYFVLSNDEVLSMTQADMILKADLNSNEDLVYVTDVYEQDGEPFLAVTPIVMLGEPDCTNNPAKISAGQLACNPNGFLIEETGESYSYGIPSDGAFFLIDWANYTEFPPSKPMTFNEFKDYFTANPDYFLSKPFHLQADLEATDYAFKSLVEKYIP